MTRKNQNDYLTEDPGKYLIQYERIFGREDEVKYKAAGEYWLYSRWFKKWLYLYDGFESDGATGVPDTNSNCWWWHDLLCKSGCWADGTLVSNLVCSLVLAEILVAEALYYLRADKKRMGIKRMFEAVTGAIGTFAMGGGKARENGMLWVGNG